MSFDAIVVGSGMSGGWAAKELAERGLKVLVIERGPNVEHGADYTDTQSPWEDQNWGRVNEDEIARDYFVQSRCSTGSMRRRGKRAGRLAAWIPSGGLRS